ncbi:MAG: hypothetical protein EOP43_02440 [Sphingobacteriaceae bacterium]|nr:MAG: hypothetical protein EOP43_02440 [Sphingobacteriaceae bacterium]
MSWTNKSYTNSSTYFDVIKVSKVTSCRSVFILLLLTGFLSCKRSIFKNNNRIYDAKLVKVLKKLEHRYHKNKVRINTWDQQADAYQDLPVLDENNKTIQTLTIGDSVQFVGLDFEQPDGIRAAIKVSDSNGYIPYWKVEEFEPAIRFDPDLKY